MPDKPSPNRRFQFRLRTLFISVTALAVASAWVGHQLDWIRQRHEAKEQYGVTLSTLYVRDMRDRIPNPTPCPKAPWPLRWLGQDGYAEIWMRNLASDGDVRAIKLLFPEAIVRRGVDVQ
jgi:hypothetical protein